MQTLTLEPLKSDSELFVLSIVNESTSIVTFGSSMEKEARNELFVYHTGFKYRYMTPREDTTAPKVATKLKMNDKEDFAEIYRDAEE